SFNLVGSKKLTVSSGAVIPGESDAFSLKPALALYLAIQTQPSMTATAGVAFAQQPVIRIEDQFGNLRSADTGTQVTAARNAGSRSEERRVAKECSYRWATYP